MKFHKNKLLTAVAAAALTFAVGACSSSSDNDEMAATPPPATDDEMAGTPPATDDEMAGTPPATDDEMAGTPPATDDEMAGTPPATDDEMAGTPPATDDEMAGTPPATDDEMAGTPPATDDEMAGTPPATDDEMAGTPPATPDPVELADTAYGEYLEALTAYEVAQGVHALTPTAANLAALREAVNKVVTEATEALTSAGAGTAAQLVRAQNAADATVMDSNDVEAIEAAVMNAANLVTALAVAGTAATAYDGAKAAYEATGGVTQANLDALSNAATAAKEKADAALVLAAGGSAAQLSEAQAAVAAADMAATHASGITMALESGIADALTAYNTAKTEHATAKTAHDEDASLDNANALKTAADTLLAAAMDADEKGALGATADQQTELASVSVTNAEAYVATAEDDLTTAQTAADAAAVVATTAADAAAVVATTKEAGTKMEAIGKEAGEMDDADAGLGGSGDTDTTLAVAISRDRMGTTVEFTDDDLMGEDDPKFALAMDLGKGRTMHVRTMEATDDGDVVQEVVIVSTDIAAPKATAFTKVRNAAGDLLTQVLDVSTNMENDTPAVTNEALAVDQDMPAVLALVKSSAFVPGQGTETLLTFAFEEADGDNVMEGAQPVKAFETAGTYNGAMGTYRCDGDADCTVTLDAKGAVTAMTDGWVFTPDPRATSDVPDADYLYYGFWLQKTTDEDGVLTYDEVETFATAEGHTRTGTVGLGLVKGSATYEGGSVGVYVKNVLDDQANIVTATSGHFSAGVELTATFGGDDEAANEKFNIGGKITDFVLQHGEANDWEVGLGLADFSGRDEDDAPGKTMPASAFKDMFSGVAIGDSTATAGTWNGVFYGSSAPFDHDDDEDTLMINPAPVAVTGEFNANFTDGTAAGGFGANK